ncbi:MAG: hypothetical protein PVG70_10875 [Desulfobacterales bacterium]|jgi:hypothetical protein
MLNRFDVGEGVARPIGIIGLIFLIESSTRDAGNIRSHNLEIH